MRVVGALLLLAAWMNTMIVALHIGAGRTLQTIVFSLIVLLLVAAALEAFRRAGGPPSRRGDEPPRR